MIAKQSVGQRRCYEPVCAQELSTFFVGQTTTIESDLMKSTRNLPVTKLLLCITAACFTALSSGIVIAQGIPGDGIPDVYYWTASGDGAAAPNGEIKTAGTLQLDTDGVDFVVLFVSSPTNLTAPENCLLCDGGEIDGNF